MGEYTMRLGNLSDSQHRAEQMDLPVLPKLGAIIPFKRAIDTAATTRRGVALIGPKGCGKTLGMRLGCEWFSDIERAKRDVEEGYRVRRILRVQILRGTSYREAAVLLAKAVSPLYVDRKKGRKKDQNEVRHEIVQLCLKQQIAVIVVDEGEAASDEALLLLRDVMADAEDQDTDRFKTSGAVGVGGISVVIIGDESLERRLAKSNEASERWARVVRIERVKPETAADVLAGWFPGFADHIASVGTDSWANYISSVVCRGKAVSFRLLENFARSYAHYMFRGRQDLPDRESIPFEPRLFEIAADEASWAYGQDSTRKPARSNARGTS